VVIKTKVGKGLVGSAGNIGMKLLGVGFEGKLSR